MSGINHTTLARRLHSQLAEHDDLRRTILPMVVNQLLDERLDLRRILPRIQVQTPEDGLAGLIRSSASPRASVSRLIESGVRQMGQSGSLLAAASLYCLMHSRSKMW